MKMPQLYSSGATKRRIKKGRERLMKNVRAS